MNDVMILVKSQAASSGTSSRRVAVAATKAEQGVVVNFSLALLPSRPMSTYSFPVFTELLPFSLSASLSLSLPLHVSHSTSLNSNLYSLDKLDKKGGVPRRRSHR
eukprot:1357676-Amorphochlora_amoeboformis.AAC.1